MYREVAAIPVLLRGAEIPSGTVDGKLEARDFHDLLLALADDARLDVFAWGDAAKRDDRYTSVYMTTPYYPIHRPYLRKVCMRGFQRGDLFLIWSGYGRTYELYDVGVDAEQRHSLARSLPEKVVELAGAMERAVPAWVEPSKIAAPGPEAIEQLRALGYLGALVMPPDASERP